MVYSTLLSVKPLDNASCVYEKMVKSKIGTTATSIIVVIVMSNLGKRLDFLFQIFKENLESGRKNL